MYHTKYMIKFFDWYKHVVLAMNKLLGKIGFRSKKEAI